MSALVGLGIFIILLSSAASGTLAITPPSLGMPDLIFVVIFTFTGLLFVVRAALRMPSIKRLLILFGITGSTGLSFFNFVLFLFAYVSPTKSYIVPVNTYGEAGVELILLLITVALVACSSTWVVKHLFRGGKIVEGLTGDFDLVLT